MSVFQDHGIDLTIEQEAHFETLFELFCDWNSRINLSAIREREAIYLKHFVDSLLPTKYIDFSKKRVADLGTGGGFPSLPLGIFCPSAQIQAFDSVGKKLKAVQSMADELGLPLKTVHGRLEDLGQDVVLREQYDLVVTRALAHWETLLEYALPFVKVGGCLIAYQGPGITEPLAISDKPLHSSPQPPSLVKKGGVCDLLGGEIVGVWEETLKTSPPEKRILIKIKKIRPTPKKYPREVGLPKKMPLG